MKIKDLQKEDVEDINYIIQHKGRCKGGICSNCIITRLQGKVDCSNAIAFDLAQRFLNMEVIL